MKANKHHKIVTGGAVIREVDLHLRPGQSGAEAIGRQLAQFRGEMNSAIRSGLTEIIFIHGVGSGRLKEHIRSILTEEYPMCSFQDAPFSRYGFGGATLVTVKK
ncbi:MAG: Smr/MutS family protein [Bacteroidales bacterium]